MKILFQGDSITDANRNRANIHDLGQGYAKYAAPLIAKAMPDTEFEFIDLGIDDEYDEEENEVTIYGDPKSFGILQKALEEKGFEITGNEFTRIPNDQKDVTDEQRATIDKIVERLEEDDDVQNVYTNMKPAEV